MNNIVIIDDEEELLSVIESLLAKIDVKAHPFTNGLKAIDFIKENKPTAVIVDLAMPDINGIEVILKIKEFSKNLPIVAMSGMEWKEPLLEGALISGANKVLKKPFDSATLYSTIGEYLIK